MYTSPLLLLTNYAPARNVQVRDLETVTGNLLPGSWGRTWTAPTRLCLEICWLTERRFESKKVTGAPIGCALTEREAMRAGRRVGGGGGGAGTARMPKFELGEALVERAGALSAVRPGSFPDT